MAVIQELPKARAFAFTVDVTHADPDRAGEVAEAFAKLAIFVSCNVFGGRGESTPLRPYYHGADPNSSKPVGYRFTHTVIAETEEVAVLMVDGVRWRLREAADEDGKGCNFAIHAPVAVAAPLLAELL